jgi:sodium/hydrogen antiporter
VLGVVLGPGLLGLVDIRAQNEIVSALAEIALVTVLFTDGQRLPLRQVRATARLAGRALLVGMPLTLLGIAGLAVLLTDLSWVQALLVGAVLAPTDPVFAAAIVQREEVPQRLRRLLNVESGVNDGLALPVVLVLLAHSGTPQGSTDPLFLVAELLGGVGAGAQLDRRADRALAHRTRGTGGGTTVKVGHRPGSQWPAISMPHCVSCRSPGRWSGAVRTTAAGRGPDR